MSQGFDPYYEWLGIQPKDQPPNHYRLLGIELFEPNAKAIANAADRQMAHLKACSAGPQAELSQKLLNEVSAARVCLLNPQARAKYDEQLQAQLKPRVPAAPATAKPAAAAPSPAPAAQPRTRATAAPLPVAEPLVAPEPYRKRPQPKRAAKPPVVLGLIAIAVLLLGGIAAFVFTRDAEPVVSNAPRKPAPRDAVQPKPAPKKPSALSSTVRSERPRPPAEVKPPSPPTNQSELPKEPATELEHDLPGKTSDGIDSTNIASGDTPDQTTDEDDASGDDHSITADRIVIWNARDAQFAEVGARSCNVLLLRNDQRVWQKRDVKLPLSRDRDENVVLKLPPERFDAVRVELTDWEKELPALSEVEVYSKGKNVARGARVRATSAHHPMKDGADNLVDGAKGTQKSAAPYWMPIVGRRGWAEIDLRPPTAGIKADRIVVWNQNNGRNGNFGSAECNVLLYRGPRVVWRRDAIEIPWSQTKAEKVEVALPKVEFDRTRVEVTKFHGGGGGLAEIEVYQGDRNVALGAPAFASSTWGHEPRFMPNCVTDGISSDDRGQKGYWLSAGEPPSWVDVELTGFQRATPAKPAKPRVDRIVIWNQHHGDRGERGADICDIVLLDGEREVWRRGHVKIPWLPDQDTFATVPLPKVRFSRVRVEQNWWFGNSGGLAEIEVFHKGKNIARQARVTASAHWGNGNSYRPTLVQDGITSSANVESGYWLLPDNTPGWVELDVGQINAHIAASASPPAAGSHGENDAGDLERRRAPPTSEQQIAARKLMREVYADALSKAKKPEDQMKLAGDFLARGRELRESPADQYVLFDAARKMAAEAGNYTLAGEAIEELAAAFQVKAGALRTEALLESAKKAKTTADFQAATQAALDLLDEAEEALDWDRAAQLAKAAVSFSAKARDLGLAKTAKDRSQGLDARKKLADEAATARATLDKNPNDPEANLTLGQYLCLARHDWKAGLPLLAKSSDERLKALATAELGEPTTAAEMVKLADRWWDFAGTQGDESRTPFLAHAAEWYERGVDAGASGIDGAKAAKRIEEASVRGGRVITGEQCISYAATYTASSPTAWGPLGTLMSGFGPLHGDTFAFCTNSEPGAHIVIELGAEKTIQRLELENRRVTSGEFNRASGIAVWLSSVAGERGQQVWRAAEAQARWNVVLPKPVRARYVTIGFPLDKAEHFHLASVRVFGSEPAPARGPSGTGRVHTIHRTLRYPLREHPSDAVGFRGHWYKYFDKSVDPSEAQRQCAAMGGYLVCLESQDEYNFIRKMPVSRSLHFGLYEGADGKWSWLSGQPLTINHWASGEPQAAGLTAEFRTSGDWAVTGQSLPFICEWEY